MASREEKGILKRFLFLLLGVIALLSYRALSFLYAQLTEVSSISLDDATLKLVLSGVWVVVAIIVTIIARQNPLDSFRIFTKTGKKEWLTIPAISVFAFIFGVSLNRIILFLIQILPIPEKVMTEYKNTPTITGKNPFILIIALYVAAPIVEELIFRGKSFYYLENTMDGFWGKVIAIISTSVVFGLYHNSKLQCVYAIICGAIFSILTIKTGSIITSCFAHLGFNLGSVILMAFTGTQDETAEIITYVICFILIPITLAAIIVIADWNKVEEKKQDESIYLNEK